MKLKYQKNNYDVFLKNSFKTMYIEQNQLAYVELNCASKPPESVSFLTSVCFPENY